MYLIATRKYRGKKYRTRYYRECLDARPRYTSKRNAPRFLEQEAHDIAAQLRTLSPRSHIVVVSEAARPPRINGIAPDPAPVAEQVDAFKEPL